MKLKIVQHVQVGFLAYFLSACLLAHPPKKNTKKKPQKNKETKKKNQPKQRNKKNIGQNSIFFKIKNSTSFIPIKCQYFSKLFSFFFFKLPTLKACSTEQ